MHGGDALVSTVGDGASESSSSSSSVHGDDDLFHGKLISQDLDNAPKEELFRLLRAKGHNPIQRSIRAGNICVKCTVCLGELRASTYRCDAWKVSSLCTNLGRQCGRDALVSDASEAKKAPKTAADQFTQTEPILAGTCVLCQRRLRA